MKIQIVSEEITHELRTIVTALNKRDVPNSDLLGQITARIADLEARMHKIETLLVTKTVAGKSKLTDEGQRVGVLWYQKQ